MVSFAEFNLIEMLTNPIVALGIVVIMTQFTKEIVDGLFSFLGWIATVIVAVVYKWIGREAKKIIFRPKTKYVVYFWSFLIMLMPLYFQAPLTYEKLASLAIYAVLLTMTAQKSYESILDSAIPKINGIPGETTQKIKIPMSNEGMSNSKPIEEEFPEKFKPPNTGV